MSQPANLSRVLAAVLSNEERWAANPGDIWGQDTGFASINRVTGGLHPGLTFLGARTSHGKTALGMQIVYHVAWGLVATEQPGLVLVFSPEMNADELLERYASQTSQVALEDIKRGHAKPEERDLWRRWAATFPDLEPALKLIAGGNIAYETIANTVEQAATQAPIKLIFVDYLQRVSQARVGSGSSDYQALSTLANDFKSLANRWHVPVLVASQLNRTIEHDNRGQTIERDPELSDFSGSGAIENAADMAWLLWRPPAAEDSYAGPGAPQPATLFVKKNRHGGLGECKLDYYPRLVMFQDKRTAPP